MHNNNHNYCN